MCKVYVIYKLYLQDTIATECKMKYSIHSEDIRGFFLSNALFFP